MKGLPFLIAGLIFLQSCEKYTLSRIYRSEVLEQHGRKDKDSTVASPDIPKVDTAIYVSAVLVPEEYDWRRDTSYGAVQCELQLYRNSELQFSVSTGPETGISIAADTHHLLGGHLYTEYNSAAGTVIGCDGRPLFQYPQREQLRGLLIKDGNIYTLGRDLDEGGFCLRRNGEILLRQAGEVFGSLSNPLYGRNGALYEDGAAICFSFRNGDGCFIVSDGEMSQARISVNARRVMDMRMRGKELYYLADYSTSVAFCGPAGTRMLPASGSWTSASLFMHGGLMWICGDSPSGTICRPAEAGTGDALEMQFNGRGNLVYSATGSLYSVCYDGGLLNISRGDGEILYTRDSTYFLGAGSAVCAGNDIYALVNPKEREKPPRVWSRSGETVYNLNGYLSGLEVQFSLPRTEPGFRQAAPLCARAKFLPEESLRCSPATP